MLVVRYASQTFGVATVNLSSDEWLSDGGAFPNSNLNVTAHHAPFLAVS